MKCKSMSVSNGLVLTLAMALGLAPAATVAQAQTFSVFHNFGGTADGANPLNGLTIASTGMLYGTASSGGTSNAGVVFKIDASGAETVIHNFAGPDGESPQGALIMDKAGNLYGTTMYGGASGAGTVYRISKKGVEKVLYSFSGGADGGNPEAGLLRDKAGKLYGTTTAGGSGSNGTVFELSPPASAGAAWTEAALYSFGAAPDGAVPVAGVSFDAAGNLYGTASQGGSTGNGIVFQLTKSGSTWTETILHDFLYDGDGATPYAGLISDKAGNFYGAATAGGLPGGNGGGTIFELTPGTSGWTFSVLYALPGWGISGMFRDLILDAKGNLYGTTHCDGDYSSGTVYKLTPASGSWTYTSLYQFTGGSDGQYSFSNLVRKDGALYGTTNIGGANGMGVIFKVVP